MDVRADTPDDLAHATGSIIKVINQLIIVASKGIRNYTVISCAINESHDQRSNTHTHTHTNAQMFTEPARNNHNSQRPLLQSQPDPGSYDPLVEEM